MAILIHLFFLNFLSKLYDFFQAELEKNEKCVEKILSAHGSMANAQATGFQVQQDLFKNLLGKRSADVPDDGRGGRGVRQVRQRAKAKKQKVGTRFPAEENNDDNPLQEEESQNIGDLEDGDAEPESAIVKENDEVRSLTQEEVEFRNKLLGILSVRQHKDKEARRTFMTSVFLNGIIDLTDDSMHKEVTASLSEDEAIWLRNVLQIKVWKLSPEFEDYIGQFTEESCTRVQIPNLVRKSYVVGRFDPVFHEAHDIAQQISTHLSFRLEAPMRIEYKGLDYERTFAIDTIVYILNRLYRMHQDDLDIAWVEHQTPDTKSHKFDGVIKVIRTIGKSQPIIIVEFSRARKAPDGKKEKDCLKLCRNAMRVLNKLLQTVLWKHAHIYLVQSFDRYIEVKYLVIPAPSTYILKHFLCFKILVSFGEFGYLGSTFVDLMNWQADVLSMVRAFNKATMLNTTTEDNGVYIMPVQDTPKRKAAKNKWPNPGTPCPGSPCLELPFDSI